MKAKFTGLLLAAVLAVSHETASAQVPVAPSPTPISEEAEVDSGLSTAWMLAVLGAGVLAFGVGGAAIARRGR